MFSKTYSSVSASRLKPLLSGALMSVFAQHVVFLSRATLAVTFCSKPFCHWSMKCGVVRCWWGQRALNQAMLGGGGNTYGLAAITEHCLSNARAVCPLVGRLTGSFRTVYGAWRKNERNAKLPTADKNNFPLNTSSTQKLILCVECNVFILRFI